MSNSIVLSKNECQIAFLKTQWSSLHREDISQLQKFFVVKIDAFVSCFIFPFPYSLTTRWKREFQETLSHLRHKHPTSFKGFAQKDDTSSVAFMSERQYLRVKTRGALPIPAFLFPKNPRGDTEKVPCFGNMQAATRVASSTDLTWRRVALDTYYDDEFKAYYFVPMRKELGEFLERCEREGAYCGFGYGLERKFKNLAKPNYSRERCDVISLKKDPRQVNLESRPGVTRFPKIFEFIFTKYLNRKRKHNKMEQLVRSWQLKQKALFDKINIELKGKIKVWNYESFMIADEKILLELGYPETTAKKGHILALFYKQVPKSS